MTSQPPALLAGVITVTSLRCVQVCALISCVCVAGQRRAQQSQQIQPQLLWRVLHLQPALPGSRRPGETQLTHLNLTCPASCTGAALLPVRELCLTVIGSFWFQVEDEMIQCVVCEDWLHGRVSPTSLLTNECFMEHNGLHVTLSLVG